MKRFLYILFIGITLIAALLALVGFVSGYVHPENKEWIALFGLILLPVLAVNLLIGLIWLWVGGRWGWFPVCAVLLNAGFLFSMFQIHINREVTPQTARKIKIITYNVDNFYTKGMNTLPEISSWLQKEQPDIICMQECPDNYFKPKDSLMRDFAFMPYYCSTFNAAQSSGVVVFSRFPILDYEPILFPGSNNKSLKVVLDIEGDSVRLFTNHLQTTGVNAVKPRLYQAKEDRSSQEGTEAAFRLAFDMKKNFALRATQADMIREMIDSGTGDVLVCGDFNDTPASYVYRKMRGDLTDGFRDCGSGFGYTFQELKRLFRIDYVFYSKNFNGVQYDSPDLPWSDHKPVVCVIYKND